MQDAQSGKDGVPVVLDEIGVSGSDERESHGAGVGHVGGGVQPIFKKEKETEE